MHTVIETPDFISDAKNSGITDEERSKIINTLAQNPTIGTKSEARAVPAKSALPAGAKERAADIA